MFCNFNNLNSFDYISKILARIDKIKKKFLKTAGTVKN